MSAEKKEYQSPQRLSIEDFTYTLPDDKIASHPLSARDDSKLLIFRNGTIREDVFRHIDQQLASDSLILFNNSRVVKARLLFAKPTGAQIELFCLEPSPEYPDITVGMAQHGAVIWKCLIGNASAWTAGLILEKKIMQSFQPILLKAELTEKKSDHFIVRFSWTPELLSFAEVLFEAGVAPLPPYIKRKAETGDDERYQTVYAQHPGSVAAPTAGLHFTQELLGRIAARQIEHDFITLHVGAGTFQPVKSKTMDDHQMHAEWIDVSRKTIERLSRFSERSVTAVGTTSFRAMESLYWIGVKIIEHKKSTQPDDLFVEQWEPYKDRKEIPVKDALEAILEWMDRTGKDSLTARTSLLIAPGYKVKIPQALITNFHQPRSTLLLLVAAFIGDDWKSVYSYALKNDFRFLSYGDSCLLFRP